MLREPMELREQRVASRTNTGRSLHIVLWTIWALSVVGVAYYFYQAESIAQGSVDLTGLVIRSFLAGAIGLIVLTRVEMGMNPEQFG